MKPFVSAVTEAINKNMGDEWAFIYAMPSNTVEGRSHVLGDSLPILMGTEWSEQNDMACNMRQGFTCLQRLKMSLELEELYGDLYE